MGFFSKLLNSNARWKSTLIRDMLMISLIDGELDEKELITLGKKSLDMGLPKREFQKILNDPGSIPDIYPESAKEQGEYITFLIKAIYADGYIHEDEVALAAIIAEKMGLHRSIITEAIKAIESQA